MSSSVSDATYELMKCLSVTDSCIHMLSNIVVEKRLKCKNIYRFVQCHDAVALSCSVCATFLAFCFPFQLFQ